MEIKINKQPGNSYQAEVTYNNQEYSDYMQKVKQIAIKNVEVDGFRKGHAPKEMAEKKLDMEKVRGTVLNTMFNESIKRLLTENRLSPIVQPTVEIIDFNEENGAKFNVYIVEMPIIPEFDYKDIVKNIKIEDKQDKDATHQSDTEMKNQKIIDALNEKIDLEIAPALIRTETDNMMNSLFSQLKQMGANVEDYLKSLDKKIEEIRADYETVAKSTIKSDFLLSKIASLENVKVEDTEVDNLLATIPKNEGEDQEQMRLYLKSVLQKTKTLEKLREHLPQIILPNSEIVTPAQE